MAYVRRSSVALWFSIFAGPVALIIDFQLRYALLPYACETGRRWMLTAISIPLLLVALTGALAGWRGLGARDGDAMRIRFMALSGLALSLVFALTIIAMAIPDFYFHPCD
jgi:hypothetical protein